MRTAGVYTITLGLVSVLSPDEKIAVHIHKNGARVYGDAAAIYAVRPTGGSGDMWERGSVTTVSGLVIFPLTVHL